MRGFSFFLRTHVLTLVILTTSVVCVLTLMLYLHGDLFSDKRQRAAIEATTPLAITNTLASADTDNDGLYDWEEQLWKTDPKNPDSDGDGTSDGVEVRGSRNPLAVGNDSLEQGDNLYYAIAATTTNLTEGYAKDIYSDIVALQYFNTYDDTTKKKIALRAAEEIAAAATPPQLDEQRVRSTKDISYESVVRYKRAIGEALLPFLKNAQQNDIGDLGVIAQVVGNTHPNANIQLEKLISLYGDLIEKLYGIEAPQDALDLHRELIRTVIAYRHELVGASMAHSDPLRTITSMRSYSTTIQNMYTITNQLGVYFNKKGIVS